MLFWGGAAPLAIITPRFTHADLRQMPEDGRRYEVVEGEMCVSPAPKTRHQSVSLRLSLVLGRAEAAGFGVALAAPTDVFLDDGNCVQPDLLFVAQSHLDIIGEDEVRGVPDLVAEILSPGTRARDLGAKLRVYARFGVRVYWVIDPDAETVTVFEHRGGGFEQVGVLGRSHTLSCPLFPGIDLAVDSVFSRLVP